MERPSGLEQTALESSGIEDMHKRMTKINLTDSLDALLERYLRTLDEYQTITQDLSKQLSSGYMSLAQANFHNRSSAVRYGQDCYDERMQAIRKVHMIEEEDNPKRRRVSYSITDGSTPNPNNDVSDPEVMKYRRDVEGQGTLFKHTPQQHNLDAVDATPEETPEASDHSTDETDEAKETSSETVKTTDPLRWFGILVPPALRTAQSTFVGAVEGPIAQLATVARDLRTQEIEIGRLRKQIKKL